MSLRNLATKATSGVMALAMGLAVTGVAAQSTDADESRSTTEDSAEMAAVIAEEPVEEITVYGERTVPAIKAQIMRADRKMYGLWNDLNTDRQFDVHCRLEGVYASRRKERICLPAFEHGILEESWDDLSSWTGAGRPEAEIRKNREIMKQKMIEFAEQNPALRDAIIERARLQRDLTEAEARGDYGDEE